MACGCRGNNANVSQQQQQTTASPLTQSLYSDLKVSVNNNANSALEQAAPVVKTGYNILDVIQDKITGNLKYVDKAASDARLAQCHSCPNLRIGMCTKCGCIVDFKVRYEQSACPEGKW